MLTAQTNFILNNLPRGLIGLLLAVILSAAMSSTASELNALGSTTAMDLYKRNIQGRSPNHYLKASKWFTLLWGVIAICIACVANLFDNLIQLVNIIGSIFYGNVLGIFLLAFFILLNSFASMDAAGQRGVGEADVAKLNTLDTHRLKPPAA